MKKRILCIVLTLCMVMTILPMAVFAQNETVKKITDYSVGDRLEYGYYPQSKVEDETTIAALNTLVGVDSSDIATSTSVSNGWISYGYYSGSSSWANGSMTAGDWMRYTDVVLGSNKYRGVVFDSYRPYFTQYMPSAGNSYQDVNGYNSNTVYWFKYEPITWKVLDPDTGLVISKTLLDSQAFNNYLCYDDVIYDYYGDKDQTYYANNYEKSSIRKWLNEDFYNTAFSASQKNIIATTTLDNSAWHTLYSKYDSATTNDKIYLISKAEAENSNYGFNNDESRMAQGSDYAKSQGLYVETRSIYSYSGNSYWRLRSPSNNSEYACNVEDKGSTTGGGFSLNFTGHGIRPAFNFNLTSKIVQEPLVEEIGVTVSGTVKSFATSGNENESTTIELISNNETVYTTSVVGAGEQSYSIEGVLDGTYTMRVSKSNHATREYEITVDGADVEKALAINLKGDVNGDGKITVTDYVKVLQHAKGMSTLESYDFACGDVDGNNKITVTDYVRILQHAKGTEYLW